MLKDSEKTETRVHPTQKPIALAEWCFEKYGKQDDFIFDPFLGSGISIIAAEKIQGSRICYGCELSERYCDVIIERYKNLTGEDAVLEKSI
jgi:DNA modification methylase